MGEKLGRLQATGLFYQFIHKLLWQLKSEEKSFEKADFVTSEIRYLLDHYQAGIRYACANDKLCDGYTGWRYRHNRKCALFLVFIDEIVLVEIGEGVLGSFLQFRPSSLINGRIQQLNRSSLLQVAVNDNFISLLQHLANPSGERMDEGKLVRVFYR
ncbi:hypothetical protein SAMN04487969_12554 [Paenibacillus algorifonticola]|uniref:Uncharacterized protein n=1 Tax=Paenibacillus algorifonticola TaxID=684063 RepID=A0A1I2HNV8_9BACL|nr:hypothetical protein SAMN04487969_12554 [Paenibacillus algorifonticola]